MSPVAVGIWHPSQAFHNPLTIFSYGKIVGLGLALVFGLGRGLERVPGVGLGLALFVAAFTFLFPLTF